MFAQLTGNLNPHCESFMIQGFLFDYYITTVRSWPFHKRMLLKCILVACVSWYPVISLDDSDTLPHVMGLASWEEFRKPAHNGFQSIHTSAETTGGCLVTNPQTQSSNAEQVTQMERITQSLGSLNSSAHDNLQPNLTAAKTPRGNVLIRSQIQSRNAQRFKWVPKTLHSDTFIHPQLASNRSLADSSQRSAYYSVGYVGCWSNSRNCMNVEPEEIDASTYSHIIFSYVSISYNYHVDLKSEGQSSDYIKRLVKHLRTKYPRVKIMMSVGSNKIDRQRRGKPRFKRILQNESLHHDFAISVIKTLKLYGFDGVDFIWEFPNYACGGPVCVAEKATLFMSRLRYLLQWRASVSITIPLGDWCLTGNSVAPLSRYVDFITVMAYSFHGNWEYEKSNVPRMLPHSDIRDVHTAVEMLVNAGVSKEKLVLGLAFWGHVYKQTDPNQDSIGSPFLDPYSNPPRCGICLGRSGFLGYNEISEFLSKRKMYRVRNHFFDQQSLTNVMTYAKDLWVTFDDPATITARVLYAMEMGFGGVSAIFVDLDDENYSMSKAIAAGFRGR